jgi:hypothetical protein
MMLIHRMLWPLILLAVISCGFSWLYWLHEIGLEVNGTLPEDQREIWRLTAAIRFGKMHWLNRRCPLIALKYA